VIGLVLGVYNISERDNAASIETLERRKGEGGKERNE
jgi:hypothetical protein